MPRNEAGDHRDVEPTSQPIPGASADTEALARTPPQATRPGPQHKWLKPMRPDNPHRLRPGQTVITFIAPKPRVSGSAGAGDEPDGTDG
jgi:hypothetical protein